MKSKKKKGAALVAVIMVMSVLTVLGTVILEISLFQVKQASYEDKKLQAHYLARSGAEATLQIWENVPNGSKPTGKSNTCFLNSSNEFVMGNGQDLDIAAGMIGKFDVEITKSGTDTIIVSTGKVGDVSQKVTVTISEVITRVPVIEPDWVDVSNIWYDYNSGQIIVGDHTTHYNQPVKINAKKSKGIKLPNKNKSSVTYRADVIVSFSPVQVIHNSINIYTTVLSFNAEVDFKQNDGKGDITLYVAGNGVDRTGLQPIYYPGTTNVVTENVGVVYFEGNTDISPKAYYFINNTKLTNANDVKNKLIPVPEEDPYYINKYSGGETQEITSYSILWS